VDDDGAAEHALRADQLDELVRDAARGVALGVGLEVAQVADVALAVARGAVGLVVGVDCGEEDKVSLPMLMLREESRLGSTWEREGKGNSQ
jgi:hypothetical protein